MSNASRVASTFVRATRRRVDASKHECWALAHGAGLRSLSFRPANSPRGLRKEIAEWLCSEQAQRAVICLPDAAPLPLVCWVSDNEGGRTLEEYANECVRKQGEFIGTVAQVALLYLYSVSSVTYAETAGGFYKLVNVVAPADGLTAKVIYVEVTPGFDHYNILERIEELDEGAVPRCARKLPGEARTAEEEAAGQLRVRAVGGAVDGPRTEPTTDTSGWSSRQELLSLYTEALRRKNVEHKADRKWRRQAEQERREREGSAVIKGTAAVRYTIELRSVASMHRVWMSRCRYLPLAEVGCARLAARLVALLSRLLATEERRGSSCTSPTPLQPIRTWPSSPRSSWPRLLLRRAGTWRLCDGSRRWQPRRRCLRRRRWRQPRWRSRRARPS